MEVDIINQSNYFNSSYAVFYPITDKALKILSREPDYISYARNGYGDFTDEISSKYWYTKKGVYRKSCHWQRVASCIWQYGNYDSDHFVDPAIGFCPFDKFKPIYYVEMSGEVSELTKKILQYCYDNNTVCDYLLMENVTVCEFGRLIPVHIKIQSNKVYSYTLNDPEFRIFDLACQTYLSSSDSGVSSLEQIESLLIQKLRSIVENLA